MTENLSPLDDRYRSVEEAVIKTFSEQNLTKFRVQVEIEWLLNLAKLAQFPELKDLESESKKLRQLYLEFDDSDFQKVKEIEKTTNHDVKSVEYYLRNKLNDDFNFQDLTPIFGALHFGLTSEDINNLSYALMLSEFNQKILTPKIAEFNKILSQLGKDYAQIPLLSLTHGQSATPTTVGKEFVNYLVRFDELSEKLRDFKFDGKINGATGNYSALNFSYPEVDWIDVGTQFIKSLGLDLQLWTTQINNQGQVVAYCYLTDDYVNVLHGFSIDLWLYISRGIFKLKPVQGEVGSSTMPHKVNPIRFENAQGNLELSSALLIQIAHSLNYSRLQRDLSGSTILRNIGVGFGHLYLALDNITKGLNSLEVNTTKTNSELEQSFEVLTEAIQSELRKLQIQGKTELDNPYQLLKDFARGKEINQTTLQDFIKSLNLPKDSEQNLLNLTPQTYTGLAQKLTQLYFKS